ncbi:multisubstrate pseudouridine synthase 7 [Entomortierella beljakovae]|nr:multisubstrate pseudouridine synthase 7 [Entomortierella beljakovae]
MAEETTILMNENKVGIRTFVDPSIPGFSAIIKQRYSDFIVNEVDLDNNTVQLTSYEQPLPIAEVVKLNEERELAREDADQANKELSDEVKLAELSILLGNDEEIMTQPEEDKAKRTEIHKLVKERFSGRMVSETVDGTMRLRMHKKKDSFDTRGRGKTDIWKEYGGEFCRFCLFKENRETMEALNYLVSSLRVPNKVFSFAGTKDRRGVTSQWVTAHKVKAERLIGLNKTLHNMRLGNFSYVSRGMKLGDLKGNRFVITLRNVIVDSEDILNQSMISLRDRGFINYFGMQRFGTGSIGTHEVGAAILRSEWNAAVDLIMKPRQGEGPDLEKARKHWAENKNAKEAMRLFPKRWVAEYQILWSFQKAGHLNSPFDALNNIPRNLRLMYVHAYQSFVWNHMVSERIRLFGSDKPVVGDLVLLDNANLDVPENAEETPRGDIARAKVLTEQELDQYTIFDVVLPLPGHDIIYPTHAIGEKYKEMMIKDGIDPLKMQRPHKDYSLTGSYRAFMSKPANVEWEILRYDEANLPLTLTDLDKLENKSKPESIPNGKYLALILHLTLGSSQYATMAIREVCKQDTSASFQSTLNAAAPATSKDSSDNAEESTSSSSKRNIDQVEGAEEAPEAKASKE